MREIQNPTRKVIEPHLIEDVDSLQAEVNKVTERGIEDSRTINLMHEKGTWINRVTNDVQGFIDKYTMEGGEE